MNCVDWCSCDCHVPSIFPLIQVWIYGTMFALFLTSVFIRYMRMRADCWYLHKALLRIGCDDEMYDGMIQTFDQRGDLEKVDEYRRDKAERAVERKRTEGKAPLWLRGFYTPRVDRD